MSHHPRCHRFTRSDGAVAICPDCDGAKSYVDELEKEGKDVFADYCSFHEEKNLLRRLNGESREDVP